MVIHGDKLRWLFWLRRKMYLRGLSRSGAGKIIGTIFLGLFILIGGGGLAVGTWFAYRYAPAPINSEVLFLVLAGLFLIWILLPILSINTNEGLDLSKLALFPLTRAELLSSLLVSTLLDIPSFGLLLVLGAVVAGWATSLPLALITLVAMLVFYVQLMAINQLILALLQPLLQSRRFRDLSILLVLILSSSGYLCNLAMRGISSASFQTTLQHAGFSPYLQWLPPGMAARTVQQAALGNWGLSLLWLAALVIITLVVLYLALLLVERSMTVSEESQGTAARQRVRHHHEIVQTTGASTVPSRAWFRLPTRITMLLEKDLKYFWRDPQLRVLFLQSLLPMVFIIISNVFPETSHNTSQNTSPFTELWAPNIMLFSIFILSYNALGFERESLTTLMLFPIDPRYILWAKNLFVAVVGVAELLIASIIIAAISNGWALLVPTLAIGLAGLAIILGIGNFTSVFFPQKMRMVMRGFRSNTNMSSEEGCLRGVITLAAMIVTTLVLAPVIFGIVIPYINGATWIWTLVVPGALVYGVAIYLLITLLVAPKILERTPEIVGVVTRE